MVLGVLGDDGLVLGLGGGSIAFFSSASARNNLAIFCCSFRAIKLLRVSMAPASVTPAHQ